MGCDDEEGKDTNRKIGKDTLAVIMSRDEAADKRVEHAYDKALEVQAESNRLGMEAQERASARNWRLTMAMVAILGAVAMGATALKFGGYFEISSDAEADLSMEVPEQQGQQSEQGTAPAPKASE